MPTRLFLCLPMALSLGCSSESPSDDAVEGTSEAAIGASSSWSVKEVPIDRDLRIQVLATDGRDCSLATHTIERAYYGERADTSVVSGDKLAADCQRIGVRGTLVGVTIYHPSLPGPRRPYAFYGVPSGVLSAPSSFDQYVRGGYHASFRATRALETIAAQLPALAPVRTATSERSCKLILATGAGATHDGARAWHYIGSAEVECSISEVR